MVRSRGSGRWTGWVGSTRQGDECCRVIEREPPKKALCLPMMGKHVG